MLKNLSSGFICNDEDNITCVYKAYTNRIFTSCWSIAHRTFRVARSGKQHVFLSAVLYLVVGPYCFLEAFI